MQACRAHWIRKRPAGASSAINSKGEADDMSTPKPPLRSLPRLGSEAQNSTTMPHVDDEDLETRKRRVETTLNAYPDLSSLALSPASPVESATTPGSDMLGQDRTVFLGNIHPDTTIENLCDTIRGGALQNIRLLKDKRIAFVTFIEASAALSFYQRSKSHGLTVSNRWLDIGWGKTTDPLPLSVAAAVKQGATRNVYVGGIRDFEVYTEEKLRRDFGQYGEIELVNFLRPKNCAFLNFTNIANALKAVHQMKTRLGYTQLRISHGKDRCASSPARGVSDDEQSSVTPLQEYVPTARVDALRHIDADADNETGEANNGSDWEVLDPLSEMGV